MAKKLKDLIGEWERELVEERAGIRQFDAGFPKEEAERLALEELAEIRKKVDQDKVQK